MTNRINRILIVDDHPIFRQGLAGTISDEDNMEVCGQAATIQEALRLYEERQPALVIVDLNLSAGSGLELIRRLRSTSRLVKILVASMHSELLFAERALRAGADGYISKEETPKNLINAIYELLSTGFYMSPRLSSHIAKRHLQGGNEPNDGPEVALSDRELEVFTLIGRGTSTREIAKSLCLSVKTIDTHKEHIKRKLGIKDNTALIQRAVTWVLKESIL